MSDALERMILRVAGRLPVVARRREMVFEPISEDGLESEATQEGVAFARSSFPPASVSVAGREARVDPQVPLPFEREQPHSAAAPNGIAPRAALVGTASGEPPPSPTVHSSGIEPHPRPAPVTQPKPSAVRAAVHAAAPRIDEAAPRPPMHAQQAHPPAAAPGATPPAQGVTQARITTTPAELVREVARAARPETAAPHPPRGGAHTVRPGAEPSPLVPEVTATARHAPPQRSSERARRPVIPPLPHATEPTVHIAIGTVEIRAAPARAPAAPAKSTTAAHAAALTLDDYLRSRTKR